MIIIKTTRSQVETVNDFFFPYVTFLRQSKIKNVQFTIDHTGSHTEEYLSAILVGEILADVELLIKKKLINTVSPKVALKLSKAEAIVFYQLLLRLPLDPENVYLHMLRQQWIEIIHKQIQTLL